MEVTDHLFHIQTPRPKMDNMAKWAGKMAAHIAVEAQCFAWLFVYVLLGEQDPPPAQSP